MILKAGDFFTVDFFGEETQFFIITENDDKYIVVDEDLRRWTFVKDKLNHIGRSVSSAFYDECKESWPHLFKKEETE